MMPEDELAKGLINESLNAISKGSRKLVLWGLNVTGLKVLSALHAAGLLSLVSAVVDDSKSIEGHSILGLKVKSVEELAGVEMDTLIITSDKDKEHILETFTKIDERLPKVIYAGNANYEFADPAFYEIVKSCSVKSKAGGYPNMLIHLFQCLKYIAERKLQGDVAEFGVYQGGTTVFMAKVLKYFKHNCHIYGFDTFHGFPSRKHFLDMYSDEKCEFHDYETVARYCAPYNIELIIGDISETYTKLRDVDLVLTFFDTDNYSATKQALQLCVERTVQGGVLAFDHFFSPTWDKTIGERIAIRQVLTGMNVFNLHGTGIFLKM
jgi:O-methyltransferase